MYQGAGLRLTIVWAHFTIALKGDWATWVLAVATIALATATALLARAAWRALEQLRVALEQLEEVKRDRHVQVVSHLGLRWASSEIAEALQLEAAQTPESLVRLFTRARERSANPFRERLRRRAQRATIVLLRVPNYFEEAALVAKEGGLRAELLDEFFGGVAKDEWALWGPVVKKLQESDEQAFVEFERMALRAD